MIDLRLDIIPIPKGRPRMNRKTGNVYTPVRTAQYERTVAWEAKAAMKGRPPLEGPVSVVIGAWLPKGPKSGPIPLGDADNFGKAVCDALNGVCWKDDRQITQLTVTKRYSSSPALTISVREL